MTLTNLILTELQNIENREIVNTSQDEFSIDKLGGELWVWVNNDYNDILKQAYPMVRFIVARHCIALLPCFDKPSPKYLSVTKKLELCQKIIHESEDQGAIKSASWDQQLHLRHLNWIPKTIREALLTCGAMDLEELEKYALDNNLIPTI